MLFLNLFNVCVPISPTHTLYYPDLHRRALTVNCLLLCFQTGTHAADQTACVCPFVGDSRVKKKNLLSYSHRSEIVSKRATVTLSAVLMTHAVHISKNLKCATYDFKLFLFPLDLTKEYKPSHTRI